MKIQRIIIQKKVLGFQGFQHTKVQKRSKKSNLQYIKSDGLQSTNRQYCNTNRLSATSEDSISLLVSSLFFKIH